jgi:hypothetical protein
MIPLKRRASSNVKHAMHIDLTAFFKNEPSRLIPPGVGDVVRCRQCEAREASPKGSKVHARLVPLLREAQDLERVHPPPEPPPRRSALLSQNDRFRATSLDDRLRPQPAVALCKNRSFNCDQLATFGY